jgi:hypothetical protein
VAGSADLGHEHYFLCVACIHDLHAECYLACPLCGELCLCHQCRPKAH